MQWLSRPTFELEGHRRSMRRAVNSVVAKGVKISVSPTTISHGGEVTIKFSNDGTEIKPKADDWIACYTPAKSDITKTVPARWQLGECQTKLPASVTLCVLQVHKNIENREKKLLHLPFDTHTTYSGKISFDFPALLAL